MSKENNGWVSVEERLPLSYGRYLVFTPEWLYPFEIVEYDPEEGGFLDEEFKIEITHWQPLSPPPEN